MTQDNRKIKPMETPTNRMPANSTFFDKVVPALLVALGFIMTALIIFALGVLLGFIPF